MDVELVEFIDAATTSCSRSRPRGPGKGGGTPIAIEAAFGYEIRDGKTAGIAAFLSRSQALEAAGLSE